MTRCHHPHTKLENFRDPPVGDTSATGNGHFGQIADCTECESTVLVELQVVDIMPWS